MFYINYHQIYQRLARSTYPVECVENPQLAAVNNLECNDVEKKI